MRPITKFAVSGVLAMVLASGAALAAADFGGTLFAGSNSNTQGTTARFSGGGAGSVGAGGTVPVSGSVAADSGGNTGASVPTGAIGSPARLAGRAATSTTFNTSEPRTATSATGSVSGQTPSVASLAGAVGGVVKQVEATVDSPNPMPFSARTSAPIVEVDASANSQVLASVR